MRSISELVFLSTHHENPVTRSVYRGILFNRLSPQDTIDRCVAVLKKSAGCMEFALNRVIALGEETK